VKVVWWMRDVAYGTEGHCGLLGLWTEVEISV